MKNRQLLNRSTDLGLVAVLATSLFLIASTTDFPFWGCCARLMRIVFDILDQGQFPLRGGHVSIANIHLGPFFYYFMVLPALVSRYVIFFSAVGSLCFLTAFSVYAWMVRRYWSPLTSLIATLLLATNMALLQNARGFDHFPAHHLFHILFMAAFCKVAIDGRTARLPWAALAFACMAQTHATTWSLTPLFIALYVLPPRPKARQALLSILLVGIAFAPYVIAEIRDGFSETGKLFTVLAGTRSGGAISLDLLDIFSLFDHMRFYTFLLHRHDHLWLRIVEGALPVSLALGVLMIAVRATRSAGSTGRRADLFLLAAFALPLLTLLFVKLRAEHLPVYYFYVLLPPVFIIIGEFFAGVISSAAHRLRRPAIQWAGLVLTGVCLVSLVQNRLGHEPHRIGFRSFAFYSAFADGIVADLASRPEDRAPIVCHTLSASDLSRNSFIEPEAIEILLEGDPLAAGRVRVARENYWAALPSRETPRVHYLAGLLYPEVASLLGPEETLLLRRCIDEPRMHLTGATLFLKRFDNLAAYLQWQGSFNEAFANRAIGWVSLNWDGINPGTLEDADILADRRVIFVFYGRTDPFGQGGSPWVFKKRLDALLRKEGRPGEDHRTAVCMFPLPYRSGLTWVQQFTEGSRQRPDFMVLAQGPEARARMDRTELEVLGETAYEHGVRLISLELSGPADPGDDVREDDRTAAERLFHILQTELPGP